MVIGYLFKESNFWEVLFKLYYYLFLLSLVFHLILLLYLILFRTEGACNAEIFKKVGNKRKKEEKKDTIFAIFISRQAMLLKVLDSYCF